MLIYFIFFFFFFQAEDGIRDLTVTGVQTCALPIWYRRGCGLGCKRRRGVPDDHRRRPANQIGHQRRQSITLILRPAVFDRDVLALDETSLLQALAESGYAARRVS